MNAAPAKPAKKDTPAKGTAPIPVPDAAKAAPPPKKKKSNGRFSYVLLLSVFIIGAVVFVPTTVLIFLGMLPTVAASLVDRSKEKMRTLCVGFMNFAGCFPFWIELVIAGHTMEASLAIITQPMTIVVIYSAAAAGYLIDGVLSGVVAGIVKKRAQERLVKITDKQKELVERWGREITGEIPLDKFGFAVASDEDETKNK